MNKVSNHCLTYFIAPFLLFTFVIRKFYVELNFDGSKMVTGTQTQTAWAQWIRDFAEMLEPCLVEVKHQGELKLWHHEPVARGRLLHTIIHWENRQSATPTLLPLQAASSKLAWETFSRPNKRAPSVTQYPSATPGINQHNPPGQTDLPLWGEKKNWTINNGTEN
jgi:hypothetical protein